MKGNCFEELIKKGKAGEVKRLVDALEYYSLHKPFTDKNGVYEAILHSMDSLAVDYGGAYYPIPSSELISAEGGAGLISGLVRYQLMPKHILDHEAGTKDIEEFIEFIFNAVSEHVDSICKDSKTKLDNETSVDTQSVCVWTKKGNIIEFGAKMLHAKLRSLDVYWAAMCGEEVVVKEAVYNAVKDILFGNDNKFSINDRLKALGCDEIYFCDVAEVKAGGFLDRMTIYGLKELTEVLPHHCVRKVLCAIGGDAAARNKEYFSVADIRDFVAEVKKDTFNSIREIEMWDMEFVFGENDYVPAHFYL